MQSADTVTLPRILKKIFFAKDENVVTVNFTNNLLFIKVFGMYKYKKIHTSCIKTSIKTSILTHVSICNIFPLTKLQPA